jgi:hypothetical protein
MCTKTTVKAIALIVSISFFSACGELNAPLLSSGGTYQIKALVNGNSLESCTIIRQDDKIIPYFATSVVNDPDLMGLLVYLQNSKGEITGETVLYTIDPTIEATQQETKQEETKDEETKTEDAAPEDSENSGKDESAGQTEQESSETIREKKTIIDTKPEIKKYDIVIQIKSFDQEMPYFPLPKNIEIGTYSLVFEAVGRFNSLSITETDIFYMGSVKFKLNDISMYLPGPSDTRLIPPGTTVMLEAGLDFDSRLNPYVIWYNDKNIINEGNINEGAGNILWKAPEQAGFYSLRLEVLPYKLKQNFTGIFREITLPVSTKASNTGYFFGNGPDYTGKRPLAAGTAYAEQLLRAQAEANSAARLNTMIAIKATTPAEKNDKTAAAPIPPTPPELLRWYRFDGSLDDKSLLPERMFETVNEKAPRWEAADQSFGLSAGPYDDYSLRPISFLKKGQDHGGGIFLFHIRPAAKDTVFNAFFPTLASAAAADGVWMDMITRENEIVLSLKTKETSVEIPVNTGLTGAQGLISIAIEFYIRPYRFEAKLSLGEDRSIQSMNRTGEIKISGALSGESKIRLGENKTTPKASPVTSSAPEPEKETEQDIPYAAADKDAEEIPVQTDEKTVIEKAQPVIVTTVWDEFAVLYSSTPLLPEEILTADNDSEKTQNKPNADTKPEENTKTPAKAPAPATTPSAVKPETRQNSGATIPAAAKEEAKPYQADNKPADTNTALKTEALLTDIQPDNISTEQGSAAEIQQGLETKTADEEEAALLISVQ